MGVKILSDSACDLPEEIINEYNIDILPIIVIKDEKEYLDKVTIDPNKIYEDMLKGESYKTAQIPLYVFEDKFKEYSKSEDSIIYIAFSSGLSGTYQTSLVVRETVKEEYPDLDLEIVDSKSASMGFGLLVYKAAKMAKEGKTKDEILKMLDFYVNHIEHIFTVDDIEYLFRGGRVSRTQAFVGSLLNIKPILDVQEGKLVPIEKVRGRNKVFKTMLEIIDKRSENADLQHQIIGISHGGDIEAAMKIKAMIEEKFGCTDFVINIIGSAIGAHSGPGTLALFFLNENYDS